MNPTEAIEAGGNVIDKMGKNNNTLMAGGVILFIAFMLTVLWLFIDNQRSTQESYLAAIDKFNQQMRKSMADNTAALNKVSDVVSDLRVELSYNDPK